MNNIEVFDIAVAEIFGQCYQAFPVRIGFNIADLGKTIQEVLDPDCGNDIDMRDLEYEIARESLRWLIDAEYLWSGTVTNMSYHMVTLTPKALEVLNAVPKELVTKTSLGEQLGKGVKEIGKESAMVAVKRALAYGAGFVVGA